MTRSEFNQVGVDVFAELHPKMKSADIQEFLNMQLSELQDRGLDIEDIEDNEKLDEDSGHSGEDEED